MRMFVWEDWKFDVSSLTSNDYWRPVPQNVICCGLDVMWEVEHKLSAPAAVPISIKIQNSLPSHWLLIMQPCRILVWLPLQPTGVSSEATNYCVGVYERQVMGILQRWSFNFGMGTWNSFLQRVLYLRLHPSVTCSCLSSLQQTVHRQFRSYPIE